MEFQCSSIYAVAINCFFKFSPLFIFICKPSYKDKEEKVTIYDFELFLDSCSIAHICYRFLFSSLFQLSSVISWRVWCFIMHLLIKLCQCNLIAVTTIKLKEAILLTFGLFYVWVIELRVPFSVIKGGALAHLILSL